MKWAVVFIVQKTQLVSFDHSNDWCAIDENMNESVLNEKPPFKMMGLSFSSKLDWVSCILSLLLKLPTREFDT